MGSLNSFMADERQKHPQASAPASTSAWQPKSAAPSSLSQKSSIGQTAGRTGGARSKTFFDDDDIDTLLALKPNDLLRSSMLDELDGDEVDMTSLMRSVAIGSGKPPGLGIGGPPGLNYGYPNGGQGGGSYAAASGGPVGLPPGLGVGVSRPPPIGSPSRGGPLGSSYGNEDGQTAPGQGQSQNLVPKPPQLTPEQLALLPPQQLMHMEQWNLLYQQQQMRELQEQHAAQQAQQRAQQAALLMQHQQMLAQREEAAKRAAAQAETESDATSEGGDGSLDASTGTSKANRRGRWGGKATARMSPYEIDLIIRSMEHQVASENPFLDDYYHQNVRIMLNPNHYTTHRPICDVAPPKRRQLDKDPFAGSLGRISSGNARAPRVTIVLDEKKQDQTTAQSDKSATYQSLASDKPFSVTLGRMSQAGGVKVSDERRIMLTIENAFVILLELEDLKQLQHLHMHAAQQPSLRANAAEVQNANAKEAQQKDVMIMEHLHQIISLLGIPRMGSPEAQPNHPNYAKWESFILSILRIPKGARMISRLLLLLPGAVAVSILRVFVRHVTTMASLSLQEDGAPLINIADYIRRVFLQADLDLLDPMLSCLWEDASSLFAQLPSTLSAKVGFYILNAILCRVNDLKGKPDIARDPRFLHFLPKFLKLHAGFLEHLKGKLSSILAYAAQHTVRKDSKANQATSTPVVASLVTVVAPSNPRHIKPLTRANKSTPHTSEAQMWEFIFYLMLCSTVPSKKQLHSELSNELSVNSITPETPVDIVNLKTTFTGVLAQQADPGFEALYQQAQQFAAMQQQQAQQHQQQQQMMMSNMQRMGMGPQGFGPGSPKMAMPMMPGMAPPPGMMVSPMGFGPMMPGMPMNPSMGMFAPPAEGGAAGNTILQSLAGSGAANATAPASSVSAPPPGF
jgi:hypothetical protein